MNYAELFDKMHPDFFEKDEIKKIPEGVVFEEMLIDLKEFDENAYVKSFGEEVTFGMFDGSREELLSVVEQVEEEWPQFFNRLDEVFCGRVNGKLACFCNVEDMGKHEMDGQIIKIGGPGCVGTLPEYRNLGLGLVMVSKVTEIFRKKGYDYSYIHYTGVADWYGKIGYKRILKWNKKGIVEE